MPVFIETQFPIARLSAESYKERKAVSGQTLTGLGKWWGRKPLILVRASILGMLMPASNNPKKDREIYLKILTMDDAGAWQHCKPAMRRILSRAAFDAMPCLYIADGHHRSAAASRVAAVRRAANPMHTGNEAYNYFLSVIFPDNQMQILDYNRVVKDLNGMTREEFLQKISNAFNVTLEPAAVKPGRTGEFGLYMKGQWHRLNIKSERIPANDPVKRLDVSLLQDSLMTPLLGIGDPRRDKRIDFVGGIRGLKELERRVDSGDMACAFSLFPTSIADMMAVADAGQVMPPKSTWFEPKLADGLVSHALD